MPDIKLYQDCYANADNVRCKFKGRSKKSPGVIVMTQDMSKMRTPHVINMVNNVFGKHEADPISNMFRRFYG